MELKKILVESSIVYKIALLEMRDKTFLLLYLTMSLILPLGFVFMFTLFAGSTSPEVGAQLITGSIVFSLAQLGINGIGQEIATAKLSRTMELYINSPTDPLAYGIGLLLSSGTLNFLSAILTLCIGYTALGIPFRPTWLLPVFVVVSWFSMFGLGLVIGTRAIHIRQGVVLANIISFLLVFLSPSYYSLESVPEIVRFALFLNPLTSAAVGLKAAVLGTRDAIPELLYLIVFTAVLGWLGRRGVKWRED